MTLIAFTCRIFLASNFVTMFTFYNLEAIFEMMYTAFTFSVHHKATKKKLYADTIKNATLPKVNWIYLSIYLTQRQTRVNISHFSHFRQVILLIVHALPSKYQLPWLTPPACAHTHTHTHTHSLSYSTSCSSSSSLSLLRRLMQWLIVWEVPLSSLAGLEALVRGHIRSFLWTPLCLASHRETQRGVSGTHLIEGIFQWRSKTATRKLGWVILQRICH